MDQNWRDSPIEKLQSRIHELEKEIKTRHREESSLIEIRRCYQALFENSQDAILILQNRQFVDCNQAALGMLGYTEKQEVLEVHPSKISPSAQPDGRDSFEKAQEMMDLAVELGSHRFEWIHKRADGSDFPVDVLLTTLPTESRIETIHTTWRDISDKNNTSDRLRFSEERFRALVETTNDFIWEVDREIRYTYASPRIKEILGYSSEEIMGKTPFDMMPDFEKTRITAFFQSIAEAGKSFENLENINLHRDGHRVVLESSGLPFYDHDGNLAGYRGIDRDITSRKIYEQQLILTESMFNNSIEGIAITDPNGMIQRVNKAFCDITGFSEEEVLGRHSKILKSNRHDDAFYIDMWKQLGEKGQWTGEIWNRRKDGSAYPEWLSISAIRDKDGKVSNYVSLFHDISEKLVNEEKLKFLAFHDPLTKLPNRQLFYDRCSVALTAAKRTGEKMALLYMDIDNFKDINDSYGHPFGDEYICRMKDRILSICRSGDTLARYGGDEFVIVMTNLKNSRNAVEFSNRIIRLFRKPLSVRGIDVYVSLSIGLGVYPDNGDNIVTLEKNADMALYKAKKEGKNRVFLFQSELKETMFKKNLLVANMRRDLTDCASFSIHYQPKVNALDRTIHGVEALLRWTPDGAAVRPEDFIPVAEETNLIIPLGRWVMRQAMADIRTVHDAGHDISLSINLSTKQFNDENLFRVIEEVLAETGFNRSKLFFEIAESTPINDIDKAARIMSRFKEVGIQLSIDDFGTGYSSLNYLKQFPLRELKIDRSFIRDIPNNVNEVAISKTIINFAKSLNYQVVAEGVENEAQLSFLRENGCDLIQGYVYYKPLPVDQLLRSIEDSSGT